MSEEFYKNDNNSRDGYKSQNGNSYGGNRFGSERPSRPRFNRTASPVNTNYNQRGGGSSYRPRYNGGDDSRSFNSYNNDNGYQRPSQGGYRPRYNSNNGEGGYQQRAEGGYQQRGGNRFGKSRYGQSSDRGGYQQRQGGYRPRYDQGNSFEGEGNSYNKPSLVAHVSKVATVKPVEVMASPVSKVEILRSVAHVAVVMMHVQSIRRKSA